MLDAPARKLPPVRPDFVVDSLEAANQVAVERLLSPWERITNIEWVRKAAIVIALMLIWEVYARWLNNSLMFPTFTATVAALWDALLNGPLFGQILNSIRVLLMGYSIGLFLAVVLTTLAVSTRIGSDILSTLTSMFNPLPAIALLPLAMLWFGLGSPSIVFVIVHSVLWAVALNTQTGFLSVSETLRMAGQNCGLRGFRYVTQLLIPAAFPSILTGLKIGWAFGWRTQVGSELVFGVSSHSGGLGWFIYENRNLLEVASVFAGLMTVIIIGLFVESVVFRSIELRTVRRWGMLR